MQSTKMLMPNNKAGKEEIYKDLGIVFQKSSDFHKARKKLVDKEDATGDYEDNEKTLIKRYLFRNNSVVYLSVVFCFLFSCFHQGSGT